MSEQEQPIRLRPVDDADLQLPAGSAFQQLAYPSDYAGVFSPARVVDAGDTISLEPGPIFWRMVVLGLLLCVMVLGSSYRQIHHRFEFPIVWVIIAAVLVLTALPRIRRRDRRPWIVVDCKRQVVKLPRARKSIRFEDIVRLQVVSFDHVDSETGEVQLVFNGQTWCVVSRPDPGVLRQFLGAFHRASGITVVRAMRLTSNDWMVERFIEAGG